MIKCLSSTLQVLYSHCTWQCAIQLLAELWNWSGNLSLLRWCPWELAKVSITSHGRGREAVSSGCMMHGCMCSWTIMALHWLHATLEHVVNVCRCQEATVFCNHQHFFPWPISDIAMSGSHLASYRHLRWDNAAAIKALSPLHKDHGCPLHALLTYLSHTCKTYGL